MHRKRASEGSTWTCPSSRGKQSRAFSNHQCLTVKGQPQVIAPRHLNRHIWRMTSHPQMCRQHLEYPTSLSCVCSASMLTGSCKPSLMPPGVPCALRWARCARPSACHWCERRPAGCAQHFSVRTLATVRTCVNTRFQNSTDSTACALTSRASCPGVIMEAFSGSPLGMHDARPAN